MKASFVRLALATTMMMPFAPAMAADIDLPPVRPSIVSLGVIGATTALEGGYKTTFCGCENTQDMSGIDYGLGVKAGWDYYGEGGWAVGIVGDWMWGLGELAEQDNPGGIDLSRHELPGHSTGPRGLGGRQHAALRNGWLRRCGDGVRRPRWSCRALCQR